MLAIVRLRPAGTACARLDFFMIYFFTAFRYLRDWAPLNFDTAWVQLGESSAHQQHHFGLGPILKLNPIGMHSLRSPHPSTYRIPPLVRPPLPPH